MKSTLLLAFAFLIGTLNAQIVNIPDANFKAALVGNPSINTNGDSEIQVSEAQAYTGTINVAGQNINDLTGIEAFIACTGLDCNYNNLVSLDLSANTALIHLKCGYNNLNTLNLSTNTALTTLVCLSNQLNNLDLSANIALSSLNCIGNNLNNLNLSTNTALTTLRCYNNNLSNLNLSTNTALTEISCSNNNLNSLDLSTNTALIEISCSSNNLNSLNLSTNTNLTTLHCSDNNITNLDISANIALTHLYCINNNLSSLDLSTNTNLTLLDCSDNNITILDLSTNTALAGIVCEHNNLSSLDLSANSNLSLLRCDGNNLNSLDVSLNTKLSFLKCSYNHLSSLNLSANTSLSTFTCTNNNLSILNVANGNNTNMVEMDAQNNAGLTCIQHDNGFDPTTNSNWKKDATTSWSDDCGYCNNIVYIPDAIFKAVLLAHGSTITGTLISTIDTDGDGQICENEAAAYTGRIDAYNQNIKDLTGIEAFTAVTILDCGANNLKHLNVSTNTALTELSCLNNNISSLDISANTALTLFYCSQNNLSSLNVANGNNANMTRMWAYANPALTCIQHDSAFDPTTNPQWKKDATATWSDDCGLGIHDIITNTFSFSVYPNPVNNRLHIKTKVDIENISIYSVLGKKVWQGNTTNISVSNLPSGMYILQIEAPKGEKAVTRFIKK